MIYNHAGVSIREVLLMAAMHKGENRLKVPRKPGRYTGAVLRALRAARGVSWWRPDMHKCGCSVEMGHEPSCRKNGVKITYPDALNS